ncbi:nuclear transport factor 2 family protein [Altererythrobacter sp.]|uniref:nuclear transport factor 2 family protein n=1 Tax=Altererythrobacter sp. TaxID=1872480 RepID=UPI003D0958C0
MTIFRNARFALAAVALAIPALAQAAEGRPGETYLDAGKATASVADAYFADYIALDWDGLEPLLAEDASFADPTAELLFGNPPTEGRAAIMEKFRKGYASISQMSFAQDRAIHSGNMALYEGTLSWTLNFADGNVVSTSMPFVAMIRVEDGKVVSHRDYGDYANFIEAMRELRAPGQDSGEG